MNQWNNLTFILKSKGHCIYLSFNKFFVDLHNFFEMKIVYLK